MLQNESECRRKMKTKQTQKTLIAEALEAAKVYRTGAIKYLRKAADAGFAGAQANLGVIYYEGKLAPRDLKESARWFQLAADQGNSRAIYNLGVMYRDGQGVPRDDSEAFHLFQRDAEKNRYTPAQNNLGAMYYRGQGVPKDPVLAYMWVSLAADAGFEPSRKLLQKIGEGMTPDQISEAKQKAQDWTKAHGH